MTRPKSGLLQGAPDLQASRTEGHYGLRNISSPARELAAQEDRTRDGRRMRFHLEMETAENIRQGMNEEEARRAALLSFGGVDQAKENLRDARGLRWLEDMLLDFRYTLRTLRSKPGFAAVALLTLALGIGATTVMFTVINSVLLKPLPYPEPDRLITLQEQTEKPTQFGNLWTVAYPNFLDCKRESRSLDMGAWRYSGGTVSGSGEAEYVDGFQVSSELFSVLRVSFSQGRAFPS